MDNDCDGRIDNDAEDALDWFLDADGDGYGDGDVASTPACDAPADRKHERVTSADTPGGYTPSPVLASASSA